MTNIIRIKRSTTLATPPELLQGELGYSESTGVGDGELFIGIAGSNIEKIGGYKDVTKLLGIPADADNTASNIPADVVLEGDTSTASMSFVIDEDSMASNLATKVPTQQSVKAYVDAQITSGMTYKGAFDPTAGGGTGNPDLDTITSSTGDFYTVTVAGTYNWTTGSADLEVGDALIAESSGVLNDVTDWTIVNRNIDQATESVPGIAAIASTSDVNTGTNDTKFVTPLKLEGWNGSVNIVSVGTIGAGTWQGTAINQTYLVGQSGDNTGDQTSIVGITGTMAQFDTAVTNGNFMYDGDAPQAHNIASHSDTSATGTELNTLTDNSMADTLHRHSELSASDGTPDKAWSVNATGDLSAAGAYDFTTTGDISSGNLSVTGIASFNAGLTDPTNFAMTILDGTTPIILFDSAAWFSYSRATSQYDLVVNSASQFSLTETTANFKNNDITTTGTIAASNLSGTNTGNEPTATTSVEGVIELATQTEANNITNNIRVITPLTLHATTLDGGTF